MNSPLFAPVRLGLVDLPNRIVMAPLTRCRADPRTGAPTETMAQYYRQRASAGLIISESIQVCRQGQSSILTPGIGTTAHLAGWRAVVDAVHDAGGRIFAQLCHAGRVSHVDLQPRRAAPVAPSPIWSSARVMVKTGFTRVSPPRALETDEIQGIVGAFRRAARNARSVGFDGVEIHGANGYLIDQFLRDGTNHRVDGYGGSTDNRIRFALEVVEAVALEFEPGRIGFRIAPTSLNNDCEDSDPQGVFGRLAEKLSATGIAYLHVTEGASGGARDNLPFDYLSLREAFRGAYIANNGYTREMAHDAIGAGRADAVAFGRAFVANPDLVERFRLGAPLAELRAETLYSGGSRGYTDYPSMHSEATVA
jgi:N-ethylmaleimide reductase